MEYHQTLTEKQLEARKLRTAKYEPPNRVWEPTAAGKWTSREWRSGERARYAQEVLGMKLS